MKFKDYFETDDPANDIYVELGDLVFNYDDDDDNNIDIDKLTKEARLIYTICDMHAQISNGGFGQFFFNSAGNYSIEILDYLTLINAKEIGNLLQEAIKWFPNSLPSTNWNERQNQMEEFCENEVYKNNLNKLDNQFYENEGLLFEKLNQFILENGGTSQPPFIRLDRTRYRPALSDFRRIISSVSHHGNI